jgi:hypothetical protein
MGFDAEFTDRPVPDGNPEATAEGLLLRATRRLVYDLFAYRDTREQTRPRVPSVRTIVRETHIADLAPGERPALQQTFVYVDGFGRELQLKSQADPDPERPGPRWIGSGATVYSTKGNVVRRYEPFFTTTHEYEADRTDGVSTVRCYDATQRVVATLFPDATYAKTVFGAWHRSTWDRNDTVLDDPRTDPDVAGVAAGVVAALGTDWRTWYQRRIEGELGHGERVAAVKSAAHARTPATVWLDPLQRAVLSRERGGPDPDDPARAVVLDTRLERDVLGQVLAVRDAMDAASGGRVVVRSIYDHAGRVLRRWNLDSGTRWSLPDVDGRVLRSWDSRGHTRRTVYDSARRPLQVVVRGADPAWPHKEVVVERACYGEALPDAGRHNLRGRVHLQLDQSGVAICHGYDFKGNPISSTRRIAAGYRDVVDWSQPQTAPQELLDAAEPLLEPTRYDAWTRFDALNRPVLLSAPADAGAAPSVTRYRYGASNLLRQLEVQVEGDVDADGAPAWTAVVEDVEFNARGQRVRLRRGNGVVTGHTYDPLTFRLTRTVAHRSAGRPLQDLGYTYDAAGDILAINDDGDDPAVFRNRRVDGSWTDTYDAS